MASFEARLKRMKEAKERQSNTFHGKANIETSQRKERTHKSQPFNPRPRKIRKHNRSKEE